MLPGLEVQGLGSIGVPVVPADAKRIIGKASQAPYGLGEATVIDTEVRRVWQLEPSQFELRNAAWSEAVASVVDAIKRDLGIRGKVTAELYKLLVYEKGSFFKPHRDTEKTPGMFGTLVVCLPSRHEGGTLILEHDGQTKQIDFGGKDSEFQTRYVAFYADCRHKVTPVKSGYRVCLVYNLAGAGKKQPAAPHHAGAVAVAAQLLKKLFSASEPMNKLAIPFTHQYTEANFGPTQLKGADRARAEVLIRAAQAMDYECYLALLSLHQSGMPAYDGSFGYGGSWRRRRSRWSYDDYGDDNEESESGSPGTEFEEIFDEELKLEHWRDSEGQEQSFGTIHFEDNEILGLDDKEGWSYKQQVREATGNEGASMDRWYRQAVIVIWPRERHFEVLAGEGPASALPALEKLVADSKTVEDLAACGKVAKAIIENWNARDRYGYGDQSHSVPMLRALERIGDEKLAMRFLREVFPTSFNGSEGKALHALCQGTGWKALVPAIQAFLAQQKPADYHTQLNQIVTICEHLCCDPPALSKERRAACALIVEELMKVVERWDKVSPNRWDSDRFDAYRISESVDDGDVEDEDKFDEDEEEIEEADCHDAKPKRQPSEDEQEAMLLQQRGTKRIGIVASMVRLLSAIGAKEYLTDFLDLVVDDTAHYDLRAAVIPDVKSLHAQLPPAALGRQAAARLLQHCLTELRAATAQAPEPPKDWKREAKLGCKCEDCAALSRFLRDPAERVGRFPMAKQRRQHLHRQIDQHHLDCTHVTERKGSPQTLVCTKTQNSYEHCRKQYEVDQVVLAELAKLDGRVTSLRRIKKSS